MNRITPGALLISPDATRRDLTLGCEDRALATRGSCDDDPRQEQAVPPSGGAHAPCCSAPRTLLGEYAAMLLFLHAAFGGAYWAFQSATAIAPAMLAANVWVLLRAAGILSERSWTFFPTVALMAGVARDGFSDQQLDLFRPALFSPLVSMSMLALIFSGDVVDAWRRLQDTSR